MVRHDQQVVIPTGKDNWESRIEEDECGHFASLLKQALGKNGKYANVSLISSGIFYFLRMDANEGRR